MLSKNTHNWQQGYECRSPVKLRRSEGEPLCIGRCLHLWLVGILLYVSGCGLSGKAEQVGNREPDVSPGYEIACYYFPNYHPNDKRNQEIHGAGWSEWELVKNARPRFLGHNQPKVPLWGYTDESDPSAMAEKIKAAADHGIDVFIFDWYWYDDGPFLERGLEEGFLKAGNNHRIKFALMWANCDWIDIFPYKRGQRREVLFPGKVSPTTFDAICDYVIEKYFKHPSHWMIDGKPYFSIYDLGEFVENFGSVEGARKAVDRFRKKTKAAGFVGLHFNAIVWGRTVLPGESEPADVRQVVRDLGFDSVSSYVWVHHVGLPQMETDYAYVQEKYFEYWEEARAKFDVPYYPNVTIGWDPSPRTHQDDEYGNFGYPFTNTIVNNAPERFEGALLATKSRLDELAEHKILNINSWNEWTEGSYLEPDTVHGVGYLQAVKDVFGADSVKDE